MDRNRTCGDDILGSFSPQSPSAVRSETIKKARKEIAEIKRSLNLTDADIIYIIES